MGNQCCQSAYSSKELDLKEIRSTYFSFHTPTQDRPTANDTSSGFGKHHRRQSSSHCFGENTVSMMNFQHSTDQESEPAAMYRTKLKAQSGFDPNRSTTAMTAVSTMGAIVHSPASRRSSGFKVLQPGIGEDEEWIEYGHQETNEYYQQSIQESTSKKEHTPLIQEYRDNIITPKASKIELPPFPYNDSASRNSKSLLMRTPRRSQPYLTCCSSTVQLSREGLKSIPFNYGDRCEEIDLGQRVDTEETLEGQKENLRLQAQNLYFFERGSDVDEIQEQDEVLDVGRENSKQSSQLIYDFDVLEKIKDLKEEPQEFKDTLLVPDKSCDDHQHLDGSSEYQQIDIEILEDSQDQEPQQQMQQTTTETATQQNTQFQNQILNLKQQLLELQNPLLSDKFGDGLNRDVSRDELAFSFDENGRVQTVPSIKGHNMMRSIFDITERNEESEITGGTKSLLSHVINQVEGKKAPSNRCASQTFRFSNLSNNLASQNNIETELEAGVVAETLETDRYSNVQE